MVMTILFSKQNILVVYSLANIQKDEITNISILWPYATAYEWLATSLVPDTRRGVL